MSRTRSAILVILYVAMSLALACAGEGGESLFPAKQDPTSALCEDLVHLAIPLIDADQAVSTSSLDGLQVARRKVETAIKDVRSSARTVAAANIDELNNAYGAFVTTVDGISSDQTWAANSDSLKKDLQALEGATGRLLHELGCK